jgi:hypothetical protein
MCGAALRARQSPNDIGASAIRDFLGSLDRNKAN